MDVGAGGGLEHAEAEFGDYGVDVVEDVALHVLELLPFDGFDEEVELQGQSGLCGGHLAHHGEHGVVDVGMCLEVVLEVLAEQMQVDGMGGVGYVEAFEPAAFAQACEFVGRTEAHGVEVDVD